MPGRAARQDFQSMLAGFAQIERVMKQKQDDDMYNKMLDELDKGKQHHGGKIEYQGYQQQQTQADVHLLRKAQLEAAMRRNTGSSFDPGDTPTVQDGFYRTKTGWHPVKNGGGGNSGQRKRIGDMIGSSDDNSVSKAISQVDAYQEGVTPFPNVGRYDQGNDTPGPVKDSVIAAVRQYLHGGRAAPNAGAPNAGTAAQPDYAHSIPGAGPSGSSAPTSKKARALQALNDPEATDEEKMQARRILGAP